MRLLISSNTYSSWKTVPNLVRQETWDGWTGRCECTLHRAPIQALCVSICQQTACGVNSETDNDRFGILLQLQRQQCTCTDVQYEEHAGELPEPPCYQQHLCCQMVVPLHGQLLPHCLQFMKQVPRTWSLFLCVGKLKMRMLVSPFMWAICLTTWWCDWVGPLLSK